MHDLISEYVNIVIEILLFATLLGVIMFFTNQAYDVFYTTDETQQMRQELIEYRKVYSFDDKIITADDVLLAVKEYTKVYEIEIQVDNSSWYKLGVNDSDIVWNIASVRNSMTYAMHNSYKATLIRDTSGTVKGLRFSIVK